ncbi:hypothetical protein ACFYY2_30280 [Streptomyces sp. NPDC001822]|uniref:hypothetical protein n=1 Tax=Streptomyces sp. NPDC001822 TaxID=3364614 RepID=UPI0036872014
MTARDRRHPTSGNLDTCDTSHFVPAGTSPTPWAFCFDVRPGASALVEATPSATRVPERLTNSTEMI